MRKVSVRDLRNHGGRVLKRVAKGESLTVTMDGRPVAELRPIPAQALTAEALVQRRRGLPRLNTRAVRADIDRLLDPSL